MPVGIAQARLTPAPAAIGCRFVEQDTSVAQRLDQSIEIEAFEIHHRIGCLHPIGLVQRQGRTACRLEPGITWRRIDNLPYEQMRRIRGRHIGMVFQDPLTSLNPLYTVGRQLIETILTHSDFSEKGARKRALELLKEVGIPAAERRLEQIKARLDSGHELTEEEMSDAGAIFELRKIWGALEDELRQERLEREQRKAASLLPPIEARGRPGAFKPGHGHEAASALIWE